MYCGIDINSNSCIVSLNTALNMQDSVESSANSVVTIFSTSLTISLYACRDT